MNPLPQSTTVIGSDQEVSLRTLASDIKSLEHGNQTPTPEHLTTIIRENELDAAATKRHSGSTHLILTIVIVGVIAAALYIVLRPYFFSGPTPL